ncbi:hypothetical protein EDB89DRAFT_1911131 [Lactarius sanguifluus]|nr:hypothetical protein EDB89DRAFT_1911131 [Lactarius sanguifluus]
MSIPHFAESILLPRSWLERGRMILETFFYLALALLVRSKLSHQSEDAIHAAKYLHHLWDQPHQAFGVPRHAVTAFLVEALAFQVELEAENVIEETVVLCPELLTLGMSHLGSVQDSSIGPRSTIGSTHRVPASGEKHKAYLREARFALAFCLGIRYSRVFGNDDYEEALSVFDKIVTSSSSGGSQGEFLTKAQPWPRQIFPARPAQGNHVRSEGKLTGDFVGPLSFFDGTLLDVAEGNEDALSPSSLVDASVQIGDPHTDDGTIALRADMNTGPKLFLTKNNYSETLPGSLNPSHLSYAQLALGEVRYVPHGSTYIVTVLSQRKDAKFGYNSCFQVRLWIDVPESSFWESVLLDRISLRIPRLTDYSHKVLCGTHALADLFGGWAEIMPVLDGDALKPEPQAQTQIKGPVLGFDQIPELDRTRENGNYASAAVETRSACWW